MKIKLINPLINLLDVHKRGRIIDSLKEALQRELPANRYSIAWKIDDDKDEMLIKVHVFDRGALDDPNFKEALSEATKI